MLTVAFAFCGIQCSGPAPIPTSGLQLWLKADAGVTLNGSKVSRWADQSGNGNNGVQLDAERQPLLVRDALNGKPVIRFDGTDDRLGLVGSKHMSQISLFMVFRMNPGGNEYDPIWIGDLDGDGSIWGVDLQSGYTGYSPDVINVFSGMNSAVEATAPRGAVFGLWHNINVVTNGFINNTTLRADGVDAQVSLAANNMSISVPLGNPTGTGVGGIAGGDALRPPFGRIASKCDVAEVILYDTVLSDSLRRSVEQYLAAKYGLPQMAGAVK